MLGHLGREDAAQARGLSVAQEGDEVSLGDVEAAAQALLNGVAVGFDPEALDVPRPQDLQELAAAAAEIDHGGEAQEQLGVGRAGARGSPRGRRGSGSRRRCRRSRPRPGGPPPPPRAEEPRLERALERALPFAQRLDAVAQRQEALEASAQRLEAAVEGLEDQLGAGGGEGGGHAVAGVDHGQHALQVLHEGGHDLAQAGVRAGSSP